MNVLVLSSTFPYPPTRGGTQVRTFHLVEHLARNHAVTLATQRSSDVTDAEIEALRDIVTELVVFPRPADPDAQNLWGKVRRLTDFALNGTPPSVKTLYQPALQSWLDRALETGKFDALTCEHSVNEIYLRPEWQTEFPQLRTVVNIHSSVYATCKQQLATGTAERPLREQLNLPLLRRYEKTYCQKFSTLVVTTREDGLQLRKFAPDKPIAVIPNGVDLSRFPCRDRDPGGRRLVFCGAMDNQPNIDAVLFLAKEIFPHLRDIFPDASLDLVGSKPVPAVAELDNRPGVTVTGRVPSMVEYLHQSTVSVIPMRTGFGIKNKTLEAMAAGVPVVGSERALEGLDISDRKSSPRALRAEHPEEYVAAIRRLFEEPELRGQLSQAGRKLVEEQFLWERAAQRYEAVLAGTSASDL